MNKKLILSVIGTIFILGSLGFIASQSSHNKKKVDCLAPNSVIFFYGTTCPHCKEVEIYFDANKTRKKFSFQEMEVFENIENQAMLHEVARCCKIDTENIGVPMLWDGSKCLVGSEDIINFFEAKK